MLGTKFNKENLDLEEYANCAMWCNENNAMIEDKGDFYECVEIPKIDTTDLQPTLEERVRALEEKNEILSAENEMLNDVLVSLIFGEEEQE